jgi:PKD repeat protein
MKTLLVKSSNVAFLFLMCMLLGASVSRAACNASFISVPDSAGSGVTFTSTSTGTSGTTQYFWTFGDGSTGTAMNVYHVYNATGWFAICLVISDSNCQSSYCDSVYIGNIGNVCQASFNAQTAGLTTAFYSQSTGVSLNYLWDFGDGNTSTSQNATHTYAQAGQYLVCLIIWNFNCSDTSCNYINVTSGGNCSSSFIAADSSGVTYFYASAQGSGSPTYSWNFGDGFFGSGQFATHTYNATGPFYPCLTVTFWDLNQQVLCTTTTCDTVYSNGGGCQASWNWSAGTSAGEIDFADLSTFTDPIVSWLWNFGDNSTSTLQNPSHVYTQTGSYYVCLTITTALNGNTTCTNTYCTYIQAQNGGGCQASFYAYDSLNYTGFMNTSSGINFNSTQFYWDLGDGSTSTDADPMHAYNGPGPYYVCLTITDSIAGCSSTFCDSVFLGINSGCQASFTAVPDTGINNYAFYSTSTGTNNTTSYAWTTSDGYSGTGNNFHHYFQSQGWYQVCLTINVYNALQQLLCTSTSCDSIYVGNGGGSQCYAYWGSQENILDAYFADLSSGTDSIITWHWDFGDNTTSSLQNPIHTYSQSGYYYVCLTIETGANGIVTCTDTYCQSIYVGSNNTGCQANFSMYPDSSGTGFQFQNLSTGTTNSTNYYWNFGDGNSSTLENPFHTYSTNGWYIVCLTITDSIASCTSTICDSINVGGSFLCNPYFTWNGDSTNGVQFYQFNNNLPNVFYSWNFGDGDTSGLADPFHQYAAAGVYYVCLTITQLDSNGFVLCTGNYCDSVYTGSNSCAPYFYASPDSNSWGNGNMNFNVQSPCGVMGPITWDFGDGTTGTGSNPSHQYALTGWYWVCVDVEINGIIYHSCDSVFSFRLVGINEVADLSISGLYPNPASSYINISYALDKPSQVAITIYDLAGRKVKTISEGKKDSGLHLEVAGLEDISMGTYMLQISTDATITTRRIIVNR